MRIHSLAAFVLLVSLCAPAAALQPAKRTISEKDLFRFVWVADPQVSPDGSRIAFTRVTVNDAGDGYETSIWTVPADGSAPPARVTADTRDAQPRWSPDGRRLAFLRSTVRDGKPQPAQIYVLTLAGGEAWRLTDLPRGVSAPVWSPDGRRLAFTSDANARDLEKQRRERSARRSVREPATEPPRPAETATGEGASAPGDGSRDDGDRVSDVRTITRAVYRFDNAGYLDPEHRSHVWVADVPDFAERPVAARQLTHGDFEEEDPVWTRDGARVLYRTLRVEEPYYELPRTELFSAPVAGGAPQAIATLEMDVEQLALSPDGARVAFVASGTKPVRSYSQPDLWVLDLATGAAPRNLTETFDYDVGAGVGGDQRAPRGNSGARVVWSADGASIVALVAREGRANLMRFPAAGGAPSDVTTGEQAVVAYGGGQGRAPVAAVISTPTVIGDLFVVDGSGAAPRRLTGFNDEVFAEIVLTPPEEVWYTSFDGKRIQAWAQRPPDFDPSKKYPLILNIHGGPHAAYGWIFDHEFQWMAARGYVVLYPNPRGSTSYGQEFGNVIQYRYPGDDYKDLMAGVDEMIRRGYVDPERLCVTGGSGGGLLTNWAVTQTDRFKAAVSQRDISDWTAWWYTADFTLFQPRWFRGSPAEDPKDFAARSPITYVEKIRTPIMFVLGEADYRTPPGAGGEALFRALKYLRRPTAMVRFPGESHDLSRSGQPWHRVERLRAIVGWMDKYALGRDVPQFREVTGR